MGEEIQSATPRVETPESKVGGLNVSDVIRRANGWAVEVDSKAVEVTPTDVGYLIGIIEVCADEIERLKAANAAAVREERERLAYGINDVRLQGAIDDVSRLTETLSQRDDAIRKVLATRHHWCSAGQTVDRKFTKDGSGVRGCDCNRKTIDALLAAALESPKPPSPSERGWLNDDYGSRSSLYDVDQTTIAGPSEPSSDPEPKP